MEIKKFQTKDKEVTLYAADVPNSPLILLNTYEGGRNVHTGSHRFHAVA